MCDLPMNIASRSPKTNGTADVFVGWLGTDAYNDPGGLKVSQYPDAWKHQSPTHLRGWTMREMVLARRNLALQGGKSLPHGLEMVSTMLTSQLYLQCQEEIRWENGRRRPGTATRSSEWYKLVEGYCGRNLTMLENRIPAFSSIALKYSHALGQSGGEFLAGLWSNDLLRGLLWHAEGDKNHWPADRGYVAPSWSWAALPGRVKHVWPLDAKPLASIQGIDVIPLELTMDGYGRVADGALVVRSLLVGIKPVGTAWSAWNSDIEVEVMDGNKQDGTLTI